MGQPENKQETVSKSQRKRESHALQDMGKRLLELSDAELKRVPMPGELAEAVAEGRGIKAHVARKRQIKFIGKLLRSCDAEPIRAALDGLDVWAKQEKADHHRLERWRERLLEEGDPAFHELMSERPSADSQHLRQLIRKSLHEREAGKPPKTSRQLFRYLRELFDEE